MRLILTTVALSLSLVGGIAYAQSATDPAVVARQDAMKAIGKNMKVLGDMAGGKTAFDAAAAEAAKAELTAAADSLPVVFETHSEDPASESNPNIWTNWDDFVSQAGVLAAAAQSLDASSLDGVKAGLGAAGGTCRACHTAYRM